MRDQPKPTGEWTSESVMDLASKSKHSGEGFQIIADAHNATLASERERVTTAEAAMNAANQAMMKAVRVADDLEQQLAAEREKVQTLVDALKKLIKVWNASDCNDDPKVIQKAIDEGNSALAKIEKK